MNIANFSVVINFVRDDFELLYSILRIWLIANTVVVKPGQGEL